MLYNGDCIEVLKTLKANSIDLVFADPPYFLSNGGKSIHNGKIVSVNKGDWDDKSKYDDHLQFTKNWLTECYRVLKFNGSLWVSGTIHNIFDIKFFLDEIGFKIVNIVVWHKSDPPDLIYKNNLSFHMNLLYGLLKVISIVLIMMKCLRLIIKKCKMYGRFLQYK